MSSVTKTRSISIKNYESNVFNETNEIIDFYGTSILESNIFENLDSNKRITASYKVVPDINSRSKTVTVSSLKNSYFDDQNLKTINVLDDLNPKVSIGISNKSEYQDLNKYISRFDNLTNFNNISINLVNKIEDIYPYIVDINAHEIQKKGACFDPLNLYQEISRDIITEFNEKGFKALVSLSGALDCRRRSIQLSSFYYKDNKSIEPYDDHGEPDDIMSVFREQEYYERNFISVS